MKKIGKVCGDQQKPGSDRIFESHCICFSFEEVKKTYI